MKQISDFKSGMPFKATLKKGQIGGKIQIEDGDMFLCHDNPRFQGRFAKDTLGYKFSWVIPENSKGLNRSLVEQYVIEIEINGEEIKIEKPLEIAGYKVEKVGDTFIFGCGAVELTKQEIKDYFEIKDATDEKMKNFISVSEIIAERDIDLTEEDLKIINEKILTND